MKSTIWEPKKIAQPPPAVDHLQVAQQLSTFNLRLNDTEKAARSQVVLPYTNAQEQQPSQVFYIPDENDDFDEEDPDDDFDY